MTKKYWPSVTDINEKTKPQGKPQTKFKIDKSDIEDAEFTEIDDDK